ncbi:MAG: hypothetical protein EU551_00520 [Promethearchaeota archaeon]|nr:MAG: hypothetical protein EU551_00520 [Candidatus Lokiarchaeota archaeon]
MEDSKVIKALLSELNTLKSKKYPIEIILIISTIISCVITGYFLYIYNFQIGYWTNLSLLLFATIIIFGYYENKKYKPNWKNYAVDILKELTEINVLEVSDFIQHSQGFIGANYIHSTKLLDLYRELIEKNILKAKIDGLMVKLTNSEE